MSYTAWVGTTPDNVPLMITIVITVVIIGIVVTLLKRIHEAE